jgi:hypothetical protein
MDEKESFNFLFFCCLNLKNRFLDGIFRIYTIQEG